MSHVSKGMVLSLIVGSSLIILGLMWNQSIAPVIIDSYTKGASSLPFSDDERVLSGNMGMPSLAWDEDGSGLEDRMFDLTTSDFSMEWADVYVTPKGLYGSADGDLLVAQDLMANMSKGESFPPGGVGKRDYTVYNPYLDKNVTAAFDGTGTVDGKHVNIYRLGIVNEPVDIKGVKLEGGFDLSDKSLPIDEEIPFFYSDSTEYKMDPRTSVPLDISLNLSIDMLFPDFFKLHAMKENVSYVIETLNSPSQTDPGTYEETRYLVGRHLTSVIDKNDTNNVIYTEQFVYHDLATGDPLPPDQQEAMETYAVDRTDFTYVTGYLGTKRSGYSQFPTGNAEPRDYPYWDMITSEERTADYVGLSSSGNLVYEMDVKGARIEVDNPFLPIHLTPFRSYEMDSIQIWEVDPGSGIMLNYSIRGNVFIRFSGPIGSVRDEVANFQMDFCQNTTDTLSKVSKLHRDLLLPLSNERIDVFSLKASFTDGARRKMEKLSDDAAFYLNMLRRIIPISIFIIGGILIAVPVTMTVLKRMDFT
jgi:hypothetical protein